MDIKISKITLAITNMNEMLEFYSSVFNAKFREIDSYGTKLYSTRISGMNYLFCPNEIADVKATQNRHQFDYFIDDLKELIEKVRSANGIIQGNETLTQNYKSVSVVDPDGNTMVFIQKLE